MPVGELNCAKSTISVIRTQMYIVHNDNPKIILFSCASWIRLQQHAKGFDDGFRRLGNYSTLIDSKIINL